MMDSILNSAKKFCGIQPDYTEFDDEILIHINAAILTLSQIGVGPSTGFVVSDKDDTYEDYLGSNYLTPIVDHYIGCKVKLGFDNANMSSSLLETLKAMIAEDEWRLNIAVDKEDYFVEKEVNSK